MPHFEPTPLFSLKVHTNVYTKSLEALSDKGAIYCPCKRTGLLLYPSITQQVKKYCMSFGVLHFAASRLVKSSGYGIVFNFDINWISYYFA
jgi:hypothetical protein